MDEPKLKSIRCHIPAFWQGALTYPVFMLLAIIMVRVFLGAPTTPALVCAIIFMIVNKFLLLYGVWRSLTSPRIYEEADVGEHIGEYTVYNGTGFLNAIERDCL